jgi:hypothetical protein
MDNLDPSQNAPTPSPVSHSSELESLQQLVNSMLVLLLVVSGTFTIFILRQWKNAHNDLQAVRPRVAQMVAEYQATSEPVVKDFINRLTEFEKRYPDFAPILAKYGLKGPSAPTGVAPKK